ncbi:NrfD/PsrC family molybdoenzyme membrane anchor subunit [Candidatus Latescibacterota bacterium]
MEHVSWRILVAFYLFLAGLGAGALFLAVAADLFGRKRYQNISRVGALIAPWPVIFGVLLLVIDLGNPLRFWELLIRKGPGLLMFNPISVMSIGTWLVTIFVILSLLYAVLSIVSWVFDLGDKLRRAVGVVALPFALLVAVYSGVLLAATPNLLWNSVFLPAVFSMSALSLGIGGVVIVLALTHIYKRSIKIDPSIPKLEKINSQVIFLELVIIILFLLTRIGSTPMKMIIGSGFGLIMWIGIIGLLVVPFIFSIKGEAKRPQSYLIVSALELIGGFCLRYVILIGGQI